MGLSSNKKTDIGFKLAQGILSTNDTNLSWYSEKYGLSLNQIPSDIWVRKVPPATTLATANTNATNYDFITKHTAVKLVKETGTQGGNTQDHGGTLWMARENTGDDEGETTGNRMRNFINPNNHLDSTGAISTGYTVTLYESLSDGSGPDASKVISTSAMWAFYYKEGVLIWSNSTSDQNTLSNSYETAGGKFIWAVAWQYVGPTLAADNDGSITDGDVLSYNESGNCMEWGAAGGGSTFNSLTDTDITNVSTGDYLSWNGSDWVNTTGPSNGNDGVSPIALMITNPVHSLPTTAGGSVTYTGSGTNIKVYQGGTQLEYGTANGKWSVTSIDQNPTGSITIPTGAIHGDGKTFTYGDYSAMSEDGVVLTFNMTVYGDTDQAFTASQSLVKQIAGSNGSDATVTVTNIEHAFTSATDKIDIGILPDTVKNDQVDKAHVGLSNVEDKSSADIRSEIVDSDIPSTIARDTELPTKSSLGLSNVEDKSSATIRSEIVDSDIPSTIARDTELPTKSSLGLSNVEDKSSATIRSEIVDSDIPSTIARDTELPTKSSLGLSNVEDKSSADIRGEIVDSDIPSTIARDTELPTKSSLGLSNVEDKSSADIRGEIVDSDIPSTIARDTELPTKSSLGLSNVEDKSSADIRGEIVDSDIPSTIARDTELPTKSSLGLSNVEDKSSATIRSEIVVGDIPTITSGKISDFDTQVSANTDVSASKTKTDLISVTSAVDLNNMPVPSSVQTSLDLKAPKASPTFSGTATALTFGAARFADNSSTPRWELGNNVGNYLDIISTSHIKMQLNNGYGNSSAQFSILDQAGVNIWSIDLDGNIKTKGKIRDNNGNDKIDVNTSGQTDFTGNIKVKGSSPGFIYGPDADELTIESNKDLVFTIDADDNDNGKRFIFKGASTEIASLDESGDLQIDGDLAVDGGRIRNSLSAQNFTMSSSRVLLLQHGGAYDIELGNSTNTRVLTVAGDSEVVTINGTLELGHATNPTTIARSAAGTVTIEGNEIATTNKTIVQMTTAYYTSSTSPYYEPLHGYVVENTSVTSYTSNGVAAYDGKIIRIAAYNSTTSAKTREFKLFLNRQATTQTGTTMTTASYTTEEMPVLEPTDWSFSKGDSFAIQTTNSAYGASVNTTFIIEYDLTT